MCERKIAKLQKATTKWVSTRLLHQWLMCNSYWKEETTYAKIGVRQHSHLNVESQKLASTCCLVAIQIIYQR